MFDQLIIIVKILILNLQSGYQIIQSLAIRVTGVCGSVKFIWVEIIILVSKRRSESLTVKSSREIV